MTHGRKDIKIGISVRVRKPYCPHLLNLSHPISFYQCKIGRRIKTGLSLVSEPVTMVDNLRAEGGDNAETERTLAERLHKLTTLENKEVMSDSKIDQLANLVKVLRKKESPLKAVVFKKAHGCGLPILDLKVLFNPLKLHFPTFEEIGPVVFLEQNNSLHTIKVKRRIDVDFLPFARVSFRVV